MSEQGVNIQKLRQLLLTKRGKATKDPVEATIVVSPKKPEDLNICPEEKPLTSGLVITAEIPTISEEETDQPNEAHDVPIVPQKMPSPTPEYIPQSTLSVNHSPSAEKPAEKYNEEKFGSRKKYTIWEPITATTMPFPKNFPMQNADKSTYASSKTFSTWQPVNPASIYNVKVNGDQQRKADSFIESLKTEDVQLQDSSPVQQNLNIYQQEKATQLITQSPHDLEEEKSLAPEEKRVELSNSSFEDFIKKIQEKTEVSEQEHLELKQEIMDHDQQIENSFSLLRETEKKVKKIEVDIHQLQREKMQNVSKLVKHEECEGKNKATLLVIALRALDVRTNHNLENKDFCLSWNFDSGCAVDCTKRHSCIICDSNVHFGLACPKIDEELIRIGKYLELKDLENLVNEILTGTDIIKLKLEFKNEDAAGNKLWASKKSCFLWNVLTCPFQQCPFRHSCLECGGWHKSCACDKARSEVPERIVKDSILAADRDTPKPYTHNRFSPVERIRGRSLMRKEIPSDMRSERRSRSPHVFSKGSLHYEQNPYPERYSSRAPPLPPQHHQGWDPGMSRGYISPRQSFDSNYDRFQGPNLSYDDFTPRHRFR